MKDKIEKILVPYQNFRDKILKERDAELKKAKDKGMNSATLINIENEFSAKLYKSSEREKVDELFAEIKGNNEYENLFSEFVDKIMLRKDYIK